MANPKFKAPPAIASVRASRGPWRAMFYRLLRRKMAVVGLVIIAFFTLVAFLAPFLAPHDPLKLEPSQFCLPPVWVKQSSIGTTSDPRYLLGTDLDGRDVLSRLLYGTQASMILGWISAPLIAVIGVAVGLIAGYVGGRTDNLLMRLADVFYAFPSVMFYIMIMFIFRKTEMGKWQNGLAMLLLALISIGWVGVARLVRSVVLSLKSAEFVQAARCVGATDLHIVLRHVLPNCLSVIVVWLTLAIPRLIIIEALLGYVGVGLVPASSSNRSFFVVSWGGLFLDGRMALNSQPIMLLAPALCVALIGMSFAFLGDALRDALDPHLQNVL